MFSYSSYAIERARQILDKIPGRATKVYIPHGAVYFNFQGIKGLRNEIVVCDGFHFYCDHGASPVVSAIHIFFYHFITSSSFMWNEDLFI